MRLADFHQTIQSTLASKRLGTPVFVRYLVHSQDKPAAVLERLARMTAAVRDWLGQPLERLYALGAAKNGQVSLTVEFQGGGSALVGWAHGPGRGDGIDLILLGNHGAIYHDAGAAQLWDETPIALKDAPDKDILALIERALGSGRPEPAAKGGQP